MNAKLGTIHFGPFVLDTSTRRLWRAGHEIRLRRKSWDTLVHLALRPGSLISAEELLEAVWSGAKVSRTSLPTVIWELRRALKCRESPGGFIETVPGRGYVFVLPNSPGGDAFRSHGQRTAHARATDGHGSGYADAATHLRDAVDSLRRLPASYDRSCRESELWLQYGSIISRAFGSGDVRAREAYDAALRAAREAGSGELEVRALLGRCFWLSFNLDPTAVECARELLAVGRRERVRRWLPVIHLFASIAWTFAGDLPQAIGLLDEVRCIEPARRIPRDWDVGLGLSLHRASLCSLSGRTAEMKRQIGRALRRADDLGVPYARMFALTFCAAQSAWAAQWSEAERYAREALVLAEELNDVGYRATAAIIAARARMPDQPEKSLEELQTSLRARESFERWWNSCHYGWLSECLLAAGDAAGALLAVDAAMEIPEYQFRSELHRIKADVLLQLGSRREAASCYGRALEIAERQGAKLFAQRAVAGGAELG